MEEWLSPEEVEKYVVENQRLVHYLMKRFDVAPSDYDDVAQIGMMGLTKAAQTFNQSKDIKFATYASRCINNEILMYFRRENKRAGDVSLDEPINIDAEGNELTLGDKIPSPSSLFVEEIENREIFLLTMNIILNFLNPRERFIILHEISGTNQRNIAEKLDISQSYISRLIPRIKKKIQKCFDDMEQCYEFFCFSMTKNSYQIDFHSTDIDLAMTLQSIVSASHSECIVHYDGEHITIRIPANLEYFSYIAELIKEIENYEIKYP